MSADVTAAVSGAVFGAAAGLVFWLKKDKAQAFDAKKLALPAVIGAIIGLWRGWKGVSFDNIDATIQDLFEKGGGAILAAGGLQAVWRRVPELMGKAKF